MPRSQALNFAIRTRRTVRPVRTGLSPSWTRAATSQARSKATPCKHQALILQSILRSIHQKPSPLRFALLRRHHSILRSYSRPQADFLYYNLQRPSLTARVSRFVRQRMIATAAEVPEWKKRLRPIIYFQSRFLSILALAYLIYTGYRQIEREHINPTPSEWGFWARWEGRMAKSILRAFEILGWLDVDDWGRSGNYLVKLLARLEDPKREGKGITEQEVKDGMGTLLVDEVGKIGYNISSKSEAWKQGYWEALMGIAKVAEHLEDNCKRPEEKLTGKLFRWENIPSPQNPRPVPVAFDKKGAHKNVPSIDEVEPAMDSPDSFYLRILTTKGFSNRQRLDAALAYADYCDYKGLGDTASHMYDWAIDIAAGGLPEGADHVVDIQTGVINAGKESFVTENLLKASTAVAVRHARRGEVKEALPIFLSLLRARKALPPSPPHSDSNPNQRARNNPDAAVRTFNRFVNFFFKEQDGALVKSSGDEQPYHSLKEACEEVGLMAYVGEILFATSDRERDKGLSWTRDSVEAAEAVLWLMDEQGVSQFDDGRQKCKECLETGLSNWQQMTKQMSKLAKQKEEDTKKSGGWLGLGIGQRSAVEKAVQEADKWKAEEEEVELKKQKTASLRDRLR